VARWSRHRAGNLRVGGSIPAPLGRQCKSLDSIDRFPIFLCDFPYTCLFYDSLFMLRMNACKAFHSWAPFTCKNGRIVIWYRQLRIEVQMKSMCVLFGRYSHNTAFDHRWPQYYYQPRCTFHDKIFARYTWQKPWWSLIKQFLCDKEHQLDFKAKMNSTKPFNQLKSKKRGCFTHTKSEVITQKTVLSLSTKFVKSYKVEWMYMTKQVHFTRKILCSVSVNQSPGPSILLTCSK